MGGVIVTLHTAPLPPIFNVVVENIPRLSTIIFQQRNIENGGRGGHSDRVGKRVSMTSVFPLGKKSFDNNFVEECLKTPNTREVFCAAERAGNGN